MTTSYPWQSVYLAAVLETDTSQLAQRIAAAENAIGGRTTELEQDHHGTVEERVAIADALEGLTILRRERIDD
jgi:uncharacterized protein involved in exopolysaccharide biosynthesis